MSADPPAVISTIEELRLRWWLFSMLCRVVAVLIGAVAVLIFLVSIDCILQLSATLNWLLLGTWSLGTFGCLAYALYRASRGQRTLPAAARRIEMTYPELENNLINLVQLADTGEDQIDEFRQAALRESAERVASVSIDKTAQHQTRWRRWQLGLQTPRDFLEFCLVLAGVLLFAYALTATLPQWSASANRFFQVDRGSQTIESKPSR